MANNRLDAVSCPSRCEVSFCFVLILLRLCLPQLYPPFAVPAALHRALVDWVDVAVVALATVTVTVLAMVRHRLLYCPIWCQYIRLPNGFDVSHD